MTRDELEELRQEALRQHQLLQSGRALKLHYSLAATAYAKAAAEMRTRGVEED